MKKIKPVECKCSLSFPKSLMIGKQCYLCVLNQWPPKTNSQYRKYEKAVAVRLSLATPLTLSGALPVVKKIGLDDLQGVQDLIDGKIVSHEPRNTFSQRLAEVLEVV